ncbi:hypothetical protein OIU76_022588 [Salix suchowensis]|nr:hypothetical protein OIU76_022588 [Salix suchowensis]
MVVLLGGGLAGLLVAAGPVQVVVGSFLPGHQQESKNKKQRIESAPAVIPATINIFSPEEMKGLLWWRIQFLTTDLLHLMMDLKIPQHFCIEFR